MAREDLTNIIAKALSDEDFRAKLLSEPDDVLGEFTLDEDETDMVRKLTSEAFDELAVDLEDRQSKTGFLGGLSLMGRKDAVDASALLNLLRNKYGG